jgi:hypothetical protein
MSERVHKNIEEFLWLHFPVGYAKKLEKGKWDIKAIMQRDLDEFKAELEEIFYGTPNGDKPPPDDV